MQNSELDQTVRNISMDVFLPDAYAIRQLIPRYWDELCLFDLAAGRTDPIRAAAVFTRRLVFPTHAFQQNAVGIFNHPLTERQFLELANRMGHRSPVVEDFLDIGHFLWRPAGFPAFGLVFQYFRDRCDRTFDLRGEYRFLRGQRRQEDVRIGHGVERAIIPGQRGIGRPDQRNQLFPIQFSRGKLAVMILYRRHGNSQFPGFCSRIRQTAITNGSIPPRYPSGNLCSICVHLWLGLCVLVSQH